MKEHMIDKHPKLSQAKCTQCEKTFSKNCELERHIIDHHDYKPFDCEKCGKTFVLRWRLRKHLSGHETQTLCHYFNNDKECPFEKIGCKFRHELSPSCNLNRHEKPTDIQPSLLGRTDISEQKSSFYTSTPKKKKCDKCQENSQCEECYLMNMFRSFWSIKG